MHASGQESTLPVAPESESPQQRATIGVARLLLQHTPGDRIANVSELRAKLRVGAGTVQKVLRDLQDRGAIALVSKQRQGTILSNRDIGALWRIAELRPLTVVLPLPASWEFQGLASGLRASAEDLGVPFTFLFGHGAEERGRAVRDGVADLAVMSAFAARTIGWDLVSAAVLQPGTYYAPESVVVLARTGRSEMTDHPRIGIDRGSADHVALTTREFPGSRLVEVSYAHIPSALTQGIIDAAVWHRSATMMSLADRDLIDWSPDHHQDEAPSGLDAATLVVRPTDTAVLAATRALDLDLVVVRQADVVRGVTLASY